MEMLRAPSKCAHTRGMSVCSPRFMSFSQSTTSGGSAWPSTAVTCQGAVKVNGGNPLYSNCNNGSVSKLTDEKEQRAAATGIWVDCNINGADIGTTIISAQRPFAGRSKDAVAEAAV